MENSILPFVEVRLEWAAHHTWRAGDTVARGPVGAYALWLVLDGTLEVTAEGRKWRVEPGSAFLLPPHVPRDLHTPVGAQWLSVGLNAQIFGRVDLLKTLALPAEWRPEPGERTALELWMRQIASEWVEAPAPLNQANFWKSSRVSLPHRQPRDAVSSFISAGLGHALFGMCWRTLSAGAPLKRAVLADAPPWLTHTLQQIAREPGVSVHDLAHDAGFSAAQFRRVFHTWVGASPQTYLTQCRLEEARRLLTATDLTVDVVAHKVGFEGASYFTRLFKERFAASPARFRQMNRHNNV